MIVLSLLILQSWIDQNRSKAIFNDKLEFQINDSIIWYNDGKLYLLSTDNKQDLNERKNKVGSLPIFGTSELNVPEERESTNIITKGTCDYDSRGLLINILSHVHKWTSI